MSENYTTPEPREAWTGITTPPAKKRRSTKKILLLIAAPLLLLTSCGTGMAMGAGAPAEPAPAVTVTAEPEPAVTVTAEPIIEEVEVEVPVTPAACLEALDLAEQGFDLSAEAMSYMAAAMNAAAEFDVAGIEQASADLNLVNPQLEALAGPMNAAKADCRAS